MLTHTNVHKTHTHRATHVHRGIWCSPCLKPNSCYHCKLYTVLHSQGFWGESRAFIWEPSSIQKPTVSEPVTYWLMVNISKPLPYINTWQVQPKYQVNENNTEALRHRQRMYALAQTDISKYPCLQSLGTYLWVMSFLFTLFNLSAP